MQYEMFSNIVNLNLSSEKKRVKQADTKFKEIIFNRIFNLNTIESDGDEHHVPSFLQHLPYWNISPNFIPVPTLYDGFANAYSYLSAMSEAMCTDAELDFDDFQEQIDLYELSPDQEFNSTDDDLNGMFPCCVVINDLALFWSGISNNGTITYRPYFDFTNAVLESFLNSLRTDFPYLDESSLLLFSKYFLDTAYYLGESGSANIAVFSCSAILDFFQYQDNNIFLSDDMELVQKLNQCITLLENPYNTTEQSPQNKLINIDNYFLCKTETEYLLFVLIGFGDDLTDYMEFEKGPKLDNSIDIFNGNIKFWHTLFYTSLFLKELDSKYHFIK